MGQTLDLGRRIELISMDRHCGDITVGLYEQQHTDGPSYRVHTYSQHPGSADRIAFLVRAMEVFGGLVPVPDGSLRFPCGSRHLMAIRRVFLDTWKLPSTSTLETPALHILDKKCNAVLTAVCRANGVYEIRGERADEEVNRRVTVYARGLLKLAELTELPNDATAVEFPCHQSHHALVGLLMRRAGDVRTAIREAAMMSARGVLAAPSNQAPPES